MVSGFVVTVFVVMLLGNVIEALVTSKPQTFIFLGFALGLPAVGILFLPFQGERSSLERLWLALLAFSVAGLVILPISAVDFFQPADVVVSKGLRAPLLEESFKVLAVLRDIGIPIP